MPAQPLAKKIEDRIRVAAYNLGVSDPIEDLGGILDRSFSLPEGDLRYAANALTPGAVPFEPSFSERSPNTLRFTIEPLGPGAPPAARRDEATREMRRLIRRMFGPEAVRWFDERSEEWRGLFGPPKLTYGAWFGSAYDQDGLQSSKVYYELRPNQLDALPPELVAMAQVAMQTLPSLVPVFTTIACEREHGRQRITFLHWGSVRLADLQPLLDRLGLARQHASVMQVLGLALGGRFDLPERSLFVGLSGSLANPEVKLEVALGMLPDLPPSFLNLLSLGLSERPRELMALQRWLQAFTPEEVGWPGRFSILSVRITPHMAARVSLYLRPIEFDFSQQQNAQLGSGMNGANRLG